MGGTEEQITEIDELFKEASFAEESAEWYYRHGREWEARGRNARAKIQFLQQCWSAVDKADYDG